MNTTLRRSTLTVAAVAATGLVALSAPGMAQGLQQIVNAHKVDGLHAKDLTRAAYFANDVDTNNFDTCAYTPLLTRNFKTTHSGLISVVANVNSERDFDNANPGLLSARVTVDGNVASAPSTMRLDGTDDHTTTAIGAWKAGKGTHTIVVQARECGVGMAYVTSESLLVSYSPFGGTETPPALKPIAKATQK